jgi:hypothetical protein
MKRIARSLVVALFFVAFLAGGATPAGCSCNRPPQPARKQVALALVVSSITSVRRVPPPLLAPGDPPPKLELMVLNDKDAGIVFYFETDGRHVTALRRDGSVIWHRDLVESAAEKGFSKGEKKLWPVVDFAGPPDAPSVQRLREIGNQGDYITVGFNTGEVGLVNKLTGEYHFRGKD